LQRQISCDREAQMPRVMLQKAPRDRSAYVADDGSTEGAETRSRLEMQLRLDAWSLQCSRGNWEANKLSKAWYAESKLRFEQWVESKLDPA